MILNIVCEGDQSKYDGGVSDFSLASYLLDKGQVDRIIDVSGKDKESVSEVENR